MPDLLAPLATRDHHSTSGKKICRPAPRLHDVVARIWQGSYYDHSGQLSEELLGEVGGSRDDGR